MILFVGTTDDEDDDEGVDVEEEEATPAPKRQNARAGYVSPIRYSFYALLV